MQVGGTTLFFFALISIQVMVHWWFGFLGSPYERDCYLGVLLESRIPNHQLKPPIYHFLAVSSIPHHVATIVIGAVIEGLMKWKGNPAEAEEVLLGEVRSSSHGRTSGIF